MTDDIPGVDKEQIKKPSIINQLVPWIITAGIFAWLYFAVDFRKMFHILASANIAYAVPSILLFSVVFGLVDSFTFGQAYSWFSAKLTNFEKIQCRVAPYVIQVFFAPLAEVFFPLYMWRKKGVAPSHSVSSSIFAIINDVAAVFTALTIATIYNLSTSPRLVPAINGWWLALEIVFWVVYFSNLIFWHSGLQPRVNAWIERSHKAGLEKKGSKGIMLKVAGTAVQLLRTFSIANWRQYLAIYGIRMISLIAGLVSNYLTLLALDIHPPLALAAVGIPIIFYAHFLPINVGGYGGPQALSILFFYEIGHCGSKEQVAAYSFLWSSGFLLGRFLIGLVFIKGFMKQAFPEGFMNWRKGAGA